MILTPQDSASRMALAAKSAAVTAASAPSPSSTVDPLDWTDIDTPAKAVLSPVLDPGFLYTLSNAAAALWPQSEGQPAGSSTPGGDKVIGFRTIDLWAHIGKEARGAGGLIWPEPQRTISSGFKIDGTDPARPVQEDGLTGERAGSARHIQNTLTVDAKAQTARWGGADQYDDLTLAVDPKSGALHLDGHLGSVDTHLISRRSDKAADGSYSVHTEGTLQGVALKTETLVSGPAAHPYWKDNTRTTISQRGTLGDKDIVRDYTADKYLPSSWLTICGHGTVAGIPTQMTTSSGLEKPACLDSRTPEKWPLTTIGRYNPLQAFFG